MAKDNLPKAQSGKALISSPTQEPSTATTPLLNEQLMQQKYGGYRTPSVDGSALQNVPYVNPYSGIQASSSQNTSALSNFLKFANTKRDPGAGGKTRTLDEYAGNEKERYDFFMPGDFDNEDAAAQGQSFGAKMVNGIGKGLLLTGTTFLQSTIGLVNGTYQAISDGKFSSFYDNEFNRALDEINKSAEDTLPNYYTAAERDANWYSPKYWATGNFLWDGVVKNLGFAAGAALSGGVYTNALKALPYASRLFSVGKSAETLAATEAGLAGANKVADTYGKVRALSDKFLSNYNTLNPAGRAIVAGLSTTGEAGIEALHSSNEFRQKLIDEHIEKYGVVPTGSILQEINDAAEGSGNATFFANVGLLTATNYIQFPKILGSTYKGEKGIVNGIVREIDDIVYEGGKYIKPKAKYPALSRLNKIRPYTFSISEAFEEVSQYSATVATQDYYNKARNGEATNWLNSIGVGITDGAFSNEGGKNALIGGISGSIMLGRGRFMQDRARSKNTAQALEDFNKVNLSNFTKETIDAVNRGTVLQQEREQAVKDGDILNSKDLEADYIANYLTPRIKYGRYDLVRADINEYKKLASTEEGFAQLQIEGKALEDDTKEAYLERLNRFEQTADNVKSLWQSLNLRYSGQIDENGKPIYSNDVINKMLYAATKVADYDQRLLDMIGPLTTAGINTSEVIDQLIAGNSEAFNEAVASIQEMDILDEQKETLGQTLEDVSEIALRRQSFLKAYQDIKENPSNFSEAPIEEDAPVTGPIETVTVKTKQGNKDVELNTPYFVGKGVDYAKDPLDAPVPISQFVVQKVNEDGTLEIKTENGEVKNVSADVLENFKIGKVSTLQNNKTANYYYNHRNEIFEFNFGKNFGGRRKGRLEYQDGKLYFVYLTPKGKVAKKELNNSYFVTQEGFDRPRISKVGSVENQQQKDSRIGFMSPSELKAQKATLDKNREARLEVLTQLGEEAKESLEETNKKLEQQTKKLDKVKEDLENIAKMKEAGPNGPKIKLNFSKATKVFTKALNNLTAMQADIEAEIDNLTAQKEELELNVSYFQDFANQITDAPEDSGEFLRELKRQVALLADNGKSLNNALSAAKKLSKSAEKAIKSAAKLFKKTLKQTDQDYSQYLSDLLDQVVAGENLLETWPLLKQEMANFALTADLSKDATVDEASLLESINNVKQLEKDLADLKTEYKARKIITDRFQSIMDEYNAQKIQEAEVKLKLSKVIATADRSAPTDFSKTSSFESQSKKSPEIIYRATTFRDTRKTDGELKPDEIRANQFGLDLDTFENRDNIRGLFLTSNTQGLKLPGVIEQILDNDPTLIEKFKDSTIVMVMVNENSELVGVDGQPIPEGAPLLDNAIYQTMPEAGFRDGSMYRKGTAENVKDAINKEYKERRDNILKQTALGIPQEIEASFGIPQTDNNARTSVEDAGLVDQDGLERDLVLYVPTTNTNVSKGTTTYNTPLGSVFLDTPTGYVKLRNRLHTKKEATAIYDAILKVAKNLINPNEGVTSDSSIRALEFLKGVTYWGVPTDQQGNRKDTGNNSVFFEKVKLKEGPMSFTRTDLIIGSKGKRFGFIPSSLEANRELIISELENIYNNVTAYKTKDVNKSFEQITSISPEGEIESIIWPNYQSYLLSNKNPDGSAREGFELPLYTNLKEKKDGEFNRVGIYFYVTNTTDEFEIPEPAKQATNIPLRKATSYTLNGETTNTYTSPAGAKINFTAFESATLENYEEKIQVLQGGDLTTVVETIKKSGKDPQQQIKQTIYNAIAPQLTEVRAQSAYKEQTDKSGLPTFTIGEEVAPAPKAPAQPASEVKVVNEVYDKIDDGIYSLNLNYKGKDYTMVIDRDGEITDASYYNPNTLKDVDVKSSFFKFTSEDIKNIFLEIEQPKQQTSEVIAKEKIPQYKMADVFEFTKQLSVEKFGTSKLRSRLEDLVDKPGIESFENIISVFKEYSIPVDKNLNETLGVLKEVDDEFRKLNMETPQNKKEADRWVELLGYKNSFIKYITDAIATKYKVKPLKIGIADNDLLIPTQQTSGGVKVDVARKSRIADIITNQLDLGADLKTILNTLSEQGYVTKNNDSVFTNEGGRDIIIFNIEGTTVPVYRSFKGTDSKTKGKWYPLLFNTEEWLVKGMADNYKEGYGNPIIKQLLDSLNTNYNYSSPKATQKNNPQELLEEFLTKEDAKSILSDNSGIFDARNYFIALEIFKDWNLNLGKISLNNYKKYLDNSLNSLIEANKSKEKELRDLWKPLYEGFAALQPTKQKRQNLALSQPAQQAGVETTDDSGLPRFTIGEDVIGTAAQQAEAQQKIDSLEDQINRAISDANSEDLRVKINQEIEMFEPENWTEVESWLKKNFPNVPVFRVKNIIQATNGRQAWGMFKDGAIYVYENAETGTAYHEVFEAVWKMFTGAEEQANIINEFKARKGTFIDRPTGQKVKYSEATPAQVKEELAEQFRDFVQKKQGVKSLGARIAKLFRDLKRFIENALLGNKAESFTDELFKRIGSGYYKKRMPYATQLSMAEDGIIDIEDAFATSDSEFRLKTLSDRQTSDTVQEMTFLMLNDFIKTDKSLLTIVDSLNKKDFYEKLLPRVLGTIRSKEIVINNIIDKTENLSKEQKERLLAIVAQNRQLEKDVVVDWPRLTQKHKEYIKAYNVEFDENDEIQLSDEDRIKESNKFDATKIDSFRKANAAIKLLLAANPIVDKNGKAVVSSINGRLLNPVSKMYITLMNKLHTSTSPDDMLNRLADMAVDDATYRTLYKRLTGKDYSDGDVDFKNIKSTNKMNLITGMWKTFKKQASDVKNIFIFSNDEVAVGDATLSSGANQLRNEYARSIAVLSKSGKSYFIYDEKKGSYTPNKKKLGKVSLRLPRDYTKFLSTLGIQFSGEEYNKLGKNTQNFKTIVEGIKQSIEKTDEVKTFSAVSLDINKRLLQLAELKTAVSNPEFSSTYFNLQGERVQTFLGVNAASELHNTLANINNINELAGTQYEYLLKDVFTQGSTIISRMFDTKTGKKRSGANDLLKGGYVGGIINEAKGKVTTSARLTQKQRIVQELNLNKEGYYLNLVPGDAGMEHMLYMGNPISANDFARGLIDVNKIFKEYFLSELELSKEDRPIAVVKGRDSKDLRFFKGILGDSLHNKIISADKTSEEVYAMYKDEINQAIASYIQNDVSRMQGYLTRYGILVENEIGNKLILENVGSPKEFDPRELTREMTAMSVNYMIANIEVHKVLYSDPYQYKDELKRTKSFLSPRQALFNNSPKANTTLNQVWNEGFEKGDIGYTNFTQDYMRTASHKDIVGVIDLPNYDSFEETDGGGSILFKAHRNFRIRAGEWNENEEKQYRYDIAYEKRDKKITLSKDEVTLLKEGNPAVQSAYTSLKPIVSGAKLGYTYNNVVLDKYALYPLSYRVMKELDADNGVKLYNKMQREDIDYIVFDSGRKVGAENSHATYVESTQQTSEVKYYEGNITPEPNTVFVFGSNPEGRHGAGAAKVAVNQFGAKYGQGEGLQGNAYALPTKDLRVKTNRGLRSIPEEEIITNIQKLYDVARRRKNNKFKVAYRNKENEITLNGYSGKEMIDMFNKAGDIPSNVIFSKEWFDTGKLNTKPTQPSGEGVAVFNDAEYESVVDVPFAIMSLQSDVPSKEKALVTRGSQTTKLITMDYMDNGVPFDYKDGLDSWIKLSPEQKIAKSPIYKEIANNQRLLEEMTNEGYQMMLKRLGIKDEDGKFIVTDFSEAAKTIRDEVFRRETNDNISDAVSAFSEGEAVLEATPAYQQVRNILYSIVDKQIVRPKISGGQKVQIPSALFESNRIAETEINGKKGYTSDVLKFYEDKDGERVMEIMVGRWFDSKMSDAELLEYLNNTEEGQKVLSGLAFRIPTQKQNSIDAFRIKKFLPKEFGDNVVVPAAIVEKVGSDFDIDKLSIYLKNVFYSNGKLKLLPFYGFGKQAKDKFAAMFDSGALFDKKQLAELETIRQLKNISLTGIFDTTEGKEFTSLFDQLGISQDEDALTILVEELKKDGVRDAVVNRMYKQSLENEFIQSSENLVSHPANFERLITPNSAKQMKAISKTIVEKVIGKEFDYTNIDNMLDRRFMSRLRQAFVSGKQAIGIAAVQQTIHSLLQRSPVFIDSDKLKNVDYQDQKYLGDGKITFQKYNKVTIDGQEYPSLSGVYNSVDQLISDIFGQFIDGYVDISKGPWIMEMGATPNVAATFMFLTHLGVPIDTIAYFMNQPIIRDYLQSVENAGYKFLFIDDFISSTVKKYGGSKGTLPTQIPSKASLLNSLGKTKFTAKENLEQVFMLQEFLKYAKMANQLYTVTQGTNWDTSRFNDSLLVFKKNEQFNKAKDSILSSKNVDGETVPAAEAILSNSFIRNQASKLNDSVEALSNFILSDRGNVGNVIRKVLKPYTSLPDRKFISVGRKAVNDLFDWAVQTDQGLNLQIQQTLLSDKGVASEVVSFIDEVKKDAKHPLHHNHVIDLLQVQPSRLGGETTPNNVSLKNTDGKAYDQNNIIYAFRDLRDHLKDETDLYDKIVTLAILQSGLSSSPISFTSLIPYEDFARIYNRTLPKIENLSNLDDFYKLGIFQRNNWNNDDIVPNKELFVMFGQYGPFYPSLGFSGYNNLKNAMKANEIPQLVTGDDFNKEYQVFTWTNYSISRAERNKMRKQGDYSYRNKGLFKIVKDQDGDPIFTEDKKGKRYPIYKAINAFGDSFRANEFYSEAKKSIIDNGMIKVDNEVTDGQIVAVYEDTTQTSKYNKAITGPLKITVKGDRVTVNNRTFVASMITAKSLKNSGFTDEQAGEIINKKCNG